MEMNLFYLTIPLLSLFLSAQNLHLVGGAEGSESCMVTVRNGKIFGIELGTLIPNKKVCAYGGIPYAAPPVGPLRFKAPQPSRPWGVLSATALPNVCPQAASPGVKISEDCLYLNVFQPMILNGSADGLPVMIWFHGGGFTSGSSHSYIPTKLLTRGDVIIVTVHYRLGLLGFLSTQDSAAPGNFGLKDQALSIRWVSENIIAFGGDPNKITIFGESAGGASVMYQLISPWNKGLIKGVIAQSGTSLSTWALDRYPSASAKLMGQRLGCPTFWSTLLVACLRRIEWKKIVDEQGKFVFEQYQNLMLATATLTPVVEPNLPGAFLLAEPVEMMRNGDIPNVPVMIGATKHDGSFILELLYALRFGPRKLDQDPQYMRESVVPDLLKFVQVQEPEGNRAVAASVEMNFLSGVNRSSWRESMPGLVDILSVYFFKSSIQNSAEILSGRNNQVFLYSFEHHSNNTLGGGSNTPVDHGIGHAGYLLYLFDSPSKFSKSDATFSEIFCDMWINFAKFGNPTPSSQGKPDEWLPYNNVDEPFMKLNITPTLLNGYRSSWRPNGFDWN